jgi:hypothetical protein
MASVDAHPVPNEATASTVTNSVSLVFIAIDQVGIGLLPIYRHNTQPTQDSSKAGTEAGASELLTFPAAFLGPLYPSLIKIETSASYDC